MKRRRILVVEDDRALACLYRTSLSLSGFIVDVADDGLSALRKLEQNVPDLVVLDLHLPRLGGDSILRELSANPELQQIPVIVVTGTDATLAIAQAAAILRKPCSPDILVHVVEHHVSCAA